MSSLGNYKLPYPKLRPPVNPAQPRANDLHIKAQGNGTLDLVGLEGIAPENPGATYAVEGQGTNSLTLSGIDIAPGAEVHIRLKHSGPQLPKVDILWTLNGATIKLPEKQEGLDHAGLPPPEDAAVVMGP